jgi:hypothetical protein
VATTESTPFGLLINTAQGKNSGHSDISGFALNSILASTPGGKHPVIINMASEHRHIPPCFYNIYFYFQPSQTRQVAE